MQLGGNWSETPFLSQNRSPSQGIHRGGSRYFSVSRTGVLAYRQRQIVTGTPVWVDRAGRELASVVDTPLDELINVRLSPDDSRLAVIAGGDVWVYDLTGRPPVKLTSDGGNDMPLWTPDGQRVIYRQNGAPAAVAVRGRRSGRNA